MTLALSFSSIALGVGFAHSSTRIPAAVARLETLGGLALILGLSMFGVELARY